MISRRRALAAIAVLAALGACAHQGGGAATPEPPLEPLRLDPLVDLAPVAGLRWIARVRPGEFLARPALASAIDNLLPAEHLTRFARDHGGVDLRRAAEIVVAVYAGASLSMARVDVDPQAVERAFAERATPVQGPVVAHGIGRTWGTLGSERAELVVFGRQAVAVERGDSGAGVDLLQAAEYFALGRLKRALPAFRGEPFASALQRLGDAPALWIAAGPFDEPGNTADGLLRSATGLGVALSPAPSVDGAVSVRVVVLGSWGERADAAAERLRAALDLLARDPLGHLAGLDKPVEPPRVKADSSALMLDVAVDAGAVTRGLRALAGGTLAQILSL